MNFSRLFKDRTEQDHPTRNGLIVAGQCDLMRLPSVGFAE